MAEELTLEQQRALAMASARLRLQQQGQGNNEPIPGNTNTGVGRLIAAQSGVPQAATNAWTPTAEADAIEAASQPGAFSDSAASAVMHGLPFADEIQGAMQAPFRAAADWYRGDGFDLGRSYDRARALELELQRRRDERSPIASTVGSIAGGAALSGQAAKGGLSLLQNAKPTLASLLGRGAAEGAAWGGLYGLGEGDSLKDRAWNGAVGSTVGGIIGGGLGALGSIGSRSVDAAALPTADDLRAAAQAAYQRADDAGVMYSPQATQRMADTLRDQFADFGYHPALQPKAGVALNEIDRLSGQNATLKGLDTARKIAGNAFDPTNRASNALSAKIAGGIDDLIANPQAGDILSGDAAGAADALSEARGLYSQSRKLDLVQSLLGRGEANAAASGSGGNVENATRQQLKRILTDASKSRGFTDTEMQAVRNAVFGTPAQNTLRLVGKLSPEGNGLMAMLHLLGGAATAGHTLPIAAVGMAAKRGAEAMSGNNARIVEALIANGGSELPMSQLSGVRKLVIDALLHAGGQGAAGLSRN